MSKKLKTYSVLFCQRLSGEPEPTSERIRNRVRQRSIIITAIDKYDAIAVASREHDIKPVNMVDVREVAL